MTLAILRSPHTRIIAHLQMLATYALSRALRIQIQNQPTMPRIRIPDVLYLMPFEPRNRLDYPIFLRLDHGKRWATAMPHQPVCCGIDGRDIYLLR